MNQQTKDYEKFVFLPYNRKGINQGNVDRIARAIQKENLLETFPVEVTPNFEVINGQHRVLACKKLGIPVVYRFTHIRPENLVVANSAKGWNIQDYMNFYCHQGKPEYIKLKEFCETNDLDLTVALSMNCMKRDIRMMGFKSGDYVFEPGVYGETVEVLKETLAYLSKHMSGNKSFIRNGRFVFALTRLFKHEDFNRDIWERKYKQHIDRFTIRARQRDYIELFQNIYNWRNDKHKIFLFGEENAV